MAPIEAGQGLGCGVAGGMVVALCIDLTSGACANITALALACDVGREEIAASPRNNFEFAGRNVDDCNERAHHRTCARTYSSEILLFPTEVAACSSYSVLRVFRTDHLCTTYQVQRNDPVNGRSGPVISARAPVTKVQPSDERKTVPMKKRI